MTSFRPCVLLLSVFVSYVGDKGAVIQECQACGVHEAPRVLASSADIGTPGEPGERLIVSGTVFLADGRTAAPNVIVYAYHTNAAGVYPRRGTEQGIARVHGYLRAWMRTDARGRYEFRTVRAGTYPSRAEPARIHLELRAPDGREYEISAIVDEADPLVNKEFRELAHRVNPRGGPGIVRFKRDVAGVWHVQRDITLEP